MVIDRSIVELYILKMALASLETKFDGHSDPSEWPFEFYERLMEASDALDEARGVAVARLGEDEMEIQYVVFSSRCAEA